MKFLLSRAADILGVHDRFLSSACLRRAQRHRRARQPPRFKMTKDAILPLFLNWYARQVGALSLMNQLEEPPVVAFLNFITLPRKRALIDDIAQMSMTFMVSVLNVEII